MCKLRKEFEVGREIEQTGRCKLRKEFEVGREIKQRGRCKLRKEFEAQTCLDIQEI